MWRLFLTPPGVPTSASYGRSHNDYARRLIERGEYRDSISAFRAGVCANPWQKAARSPALHLPRTFLHPLHVLCHACRVMLVGFGYCVAGGCLSPADRVLAAEVSHAVWRRRMMGFEILYPGEANSICPILVGTEGAGACIPARRVRSLDRHPLALSDARCAQQCVGTMARTDSAHPRRQCSEGPATSCRGHTT